uniref:Neuroepithelial cell-transforming gene 1 protein-like n=1 Tax=Dermatophagoides pteronyssinus TaxID=6956 RepID=A0A6P6XT59_DERPT|nr:neuroepithelial cell-transforming gene 1 protein-like [Dermatophagoides pteronyssinus]
MSLLRKIIVEKLPILPNEYRRYRLLSQAGQDLQYVLDQMDNQLSKQIKYYPKEDILYDKYQHAIYELFNAEINIYCKINKLIHIYQRPMLTYRIISPEESIIIFSDLQRLAEIHSNFIKNLAMLQKNGLFECPANAMFEFTKSLYYYQIYCSNLIQSRKILHKKMQQKQFVNFLQSERIRKYGEKLDLASHLDQPRRHLMKYPLILAEICRRTVDQQEIDKLNKLNHHITTFISQIDAQIDENKFHDLINKFSIRNKNSINIKNKIISTCTRLILLSSVHCWPKKWPKNCLILFDRLLILVRCSPLGNKFLIRSEIEIGNDLHYHHKMKNSNHKNFNNSTKRHSKWLRLYSTNESINFDITIKFKQQDDRIVWLRYLATLFNLIAR